MDIMGKLKETRIAKILLAKAEVLEVNNENEGEVIQKLSSEDIKEFNELVKLTRELNEMLSDSAKLNALINAKLVHLDARNKMWWDSLSRYPKIDLERTLTKKGLHVDKINHCIRRGINKNIYNISFIDLVEDNQDRAQQEQEQPRPRTIT